MRVRHADNETRKRHLWIALLLITWMLVIIWRLTWLQVLKHEHYLVRAVQNQQRTVGTLALRGSIVDRNNKELAVSLTAESVFADPSQFKNDDERQQSARLLAPLLDASEADLLKQLSAASSFVWLKRKIDPEKSQAVIAAIKQIAAQAKRKDFNAIGLRKEPQRFYPNDTLAAPLVGFVGVDDKDPARTDKGQAGLEQTQDKFLLGAPGEIHFAKDGKNQSFNRREIPATSGAQVVMTIDAALQHKIEVLLDEALRMTRAKAASVVVLDPRTGEVLALANAPGFNPNERPKKGEVEARHNRVVSWPYEPGSVFKIVTYAAAFEEGRAKPTDMINCGNGQISIGKRVINDTHAYGTLSAADAFAKSSNVCAIKLAQRLGKETFFDYIGRFGFGQKTGIELPAESRGIVNPLTMWRPDSIGSVAIGQEVSVTLLQAAAAVATIANRGVWVQPHIIKQVVTPDGRVVYEPPSVTRQVISEKTAQMMAEVMTRVVTHGTARAAIQLAGYTAAGKTGTPQKVDPLTKAYSKTKYMPSFAGFVPATAPRFAIVVMLDEPLGAHQGGSVAAPLFNVIAQIALGDFVVPPDSKEFRETLVAVSKRYETEVSKEEPSAQNPPAVAVASEPTPPPQPQATAKPNAKENAKPNDVIANALPPARPKPLPTAVPKSSMPTSAGVMPDFRGRGVRAVMQLSTQMSLNMKLQGNGIAIRQTPAPGARLRPGEACKVEFQ